MSNQCLCFNNCNFKQILRVLTSLCFQWIGIWKIYVLATISFIWCLFLLMHFWRCSWKLASSIIVNLNDLHVNSFFQIPSVRDYAHTHVNWGIPTRNIYESGDRWGSRNVYWCSGYVGRCFILLKLHTSDRHTFSS